MKSNESSTGFEIIKFVMQYNDDEFITQSYKFILRRKVDVGGLVNYRRVLYKSESKAKVLLDILSSEEGRSNIHWAEMVATVRQVRRREWMKKVGIWTFFIPFRRIAADHHDMALTHTADFSIKGVSLPRPGNGPNFFGSMNNRNLSAYRSSHSPRALMIAHILASTERA